jgi:hypothetical protein
MNGDEKAIVDYLKTWPNVFISGREVARRVGGKKRYEEDRYWAVPILTELVRKNVLDVDHMGHFRYRRPDKKKRFGRHVSPEILRILKTSGKKFDDVTAIEDDSDDGAEPAIKPQS